MRRTLVISSALVLLFALSACVQRPLSYTPNLANLEALKASGIAPVKTGRFELAPGKDSKIDRDISARALTVISPNNNSFASFLGSALTQDLRAAGKFDPDSKIVVSGMLTRNLLEAPIGTGRGVLAATFAVTRDGTRVYEKELEEKAEWPSAFIGADAIPTAFNEYTSLYRKLLGKLFGDSDFKKAAQGR